MDKSVLYREFVTVALSVAHRVLQLDRAKVGYSGLRAAHAKFIIDRFNKRLCNEPGCNEVFEALAIIEKADLESLDKAQAFTYLITTMSLFDNFLSDVTRFLFLVRPQAISKDRKIELAYVLDCESVSEIINGVISRQVHNISYKIVADRLELLRRVFGLELPELSETVERMEEYISLRNRMVHDVSLFEYMAEGEPGQLKAVRKAEPEPLEWETVEDSMSVCLDISRALFAEVCTRVFNTEPQAEVLGALDSAVVWHSLEKR